MADTEECRSPGDTPTFKIVLLGEVNVGKTSLFQRLRLDRFQEWGTTAGVDQMEKEYKVDGTYVKLQVWDTAGSEKYRTLTSNYYHSAAACICVYDLLASDSLYSLDTWISDVWRFQPSSNLFLVGNKCDAGSEEITVEESTAEAFKQKHDFKGCFLTSAKSGEGVEACFQEVAAILYKEASASAVRARRLDLLNPDMQSGNKKGCC